MDKLINVVNRNSTNRIYMFYSSPDCYTSAKHQADLTWTTNSYDYLPLRSEGWGLKKIRKIPVFFYFWIFSTSIKGDDVDLTKWWTGFYATRSNYKGYVRTGFDHFQKKLVFKEKLSKIESLGRESYSYLSALHQFSVAALDFSKSDLEELVIFLKNHLENS